MVIGLPVEEDLVNDGWTDIFRMLSRAAKTKRGATMSKRDAALMTEIANSLRDLAAFVPLWLKNIEKRRALFLRRNLTEERGDLAEG